MDEYKAQGDYPEIPIPTGDGWHKPGDSTAGAAPENGGAAPDGGQPSGGWTPQPNGGSQPPYGWQGQPQQGGPQSPYGWQGQPQQGGPQSPYGWQGQPQQGGPQSPYGWQQGSYSQPPYQPVPPKQTNNMALASMILAILALITCCCSPLVQFPLAVAAIVLAVLSKKGRPFSGYAIAGLVMSFFAILLSIVMTFLIGIVRSPEYQEMLNSPEFQKIYEEIYESMYGTD